MILATCPTCRLTLPEELFEGLRCRWCATPDKPLDLSPRVPLDDKNGLSAIVVQAPHLRKRSVREYTWGIGWEGNRE